MSSTKEIKNRIGSVRETQKITNAMYLISSTKMRKAKEELDQTRPYFAALQREIRRIFLVDPGLDNKYFFPPAEKKYSRDGTCGFLVITADKGLAGAYNQKVLNEMMRLSQTEKDKQYFVVGNYGRNYCRMHHIPIEKSFLYTAQNPTLHRAREICDELLERYRSGALRKIYIIFTDFGNGMQEEARSVRLLPLHRADFMDEDADDIKPFHFEPSLESVLENLIPGYLVGYIYVALVDSFCSEQNARMTAMDSANKNAEKLLEELSLEYNHERQSAITQEITEISSGARALRR